ncbi:hypothetical protein FACS189479_04480 [Spirochaetia bacterium]|nr:hypothetical protein FACS189479_04480 [Spirochaetia bacterium]
MANPVGTIRKFTADGYEFSVTADVDLAHGKPKYAVSGLPSTGGMAYQFTLQDTNVTGLQCRLNAEEIDIAKSLVEQIPNYPISYVTAEGAVWTGTGHISYETVSSATGVVDFTLVPDENGFVRF